MKPLTPAQRRADSFHRLLENPSIGRTDARMGSLLELTDSLRTVAETAPTPRADFVADLRERLMLEADTVLVATPQRLRVIEGDRKVAPAPRSHRRRMAVVVGTLTVVGATTSVSVAAQDALPGDALYPIKRALENVQTGLASGDAKTDELLASARARLDEVEALTRDGDEAPRIAATLVDFTEQSETASWYALSSDDDTQVEALRVFTSESMADLTALQDEVPASVRDELAAAARALAEIDADARSACPPCGGDAVELPAVFLVSAPQGADTTGVPTVPAPVTGQADAGPGVRQPGDTTDESAPTGELPAAPALPGTDTNPEVPSDGDSTGPLEGLTDTVLPGVPVEQPSSPTQDQGTKDTIDPLDPVTTPLDDAIQSGTSTLNDVTGDVTGELPR